MKTFMVRYYHAGKEMVRMGPYLGLVSEIHKSDFADQDIEAHTYMLILCNIEHRPVFIDPENVIEMRAINETDMLALPKEV